MKEEEGVATEVGEREVGGMRRLGCQRLSIVRFLVFVGDCRNHVAAAVDVVDIVVIDVVSETVVAIVAAC